MNAAALLKELRDRGVELTVRGQDIVYRAPQGSLSPHLLASFKKQKQQIIELLAESNEIPDPADSSFEQLAKLLAQDSGSNSIHQHPYARYVEPLKSRLLNRVGLDVNFVRGEGCFLWDAEGNRYVDCIAQYGGLPFGYNPDSIWAALQSVQDRKLPSVATQSLLDTAGELADKLLQLLPPEFQHVVFCNSGAEAAEVAIKLCRAAKQRTGILSTLNGFHGLTTGALACTGNQGFQQGFFVQSDNFAHVPFGDVKALRVHLRTNPNRYAAFIVEPIQGESGIVMPPDGYLRSVREICDEFDLLMVVDEVQTGLGRTGEMFAFERDGIVPDVLLIAKALGGGLFPIGAVVFRPKAYSTRLGLRHSSTFAGNACACQCGLATLERLQKDSRRLLLNVREFGEYLLHGLSAIQRDHPFVCHVRGRGFMLAIEFDFESLRDRDGLLPILVDQQLLLHLMVSYLLRVHRVRVAATFMGRSIIRIEPPLIFGRTECDWLLDAIRDLMCVIEAGNMAALVASMIDVDNRRFIRPAIHQAADCALQSNRSSIHLPSSGPLVATRVGEFGFLVHLTGLQDLVDFDSSLSGFDTAELGRLKGELTRSSEPTVVGHCDIGSSNGDSVRGQFVLLPYTPAELLQFPRNESIELVQQAAQVAAARGVQLIGLGGFTAIVTHGGMALNSSQLPPITSGNAFTVSAGMTALDDVCSRQSILLEDSEVAIVGAGGQIGRALTLLLSEKAKHLILVGRHGQTDRTMRQLRATAIDIVDHLRLSVQMGRPLAARISSLVASNGSQFRTNEDIAEMLINERAIVLTDSVRALREADVVLVASSATEPIVSAADIKPNAIVCDLSRPACVSPETKMARSDVTWIEGGLIRAASPRPFGLFAGPKPDTIYACVAETALWLLEPSLGTPTAVQLLHPNHICSLGQAAKQHGFEIVIEA